MISIDEILTRLKTKGANSTELLTLFQTSEYKSLWEEDSRLYRAFAAKLIQQGHPARGYELARQGLTCEAFKNDRDLQYCEILALARGGNIAKAESRLKELLNAQDLDAKPKLKAEIFSLEGRLLKDRYMRTRDPRAKTALAAQSAAAYERAARLPEADSFPWINWAAMTLLAGDAKRAKELAEQTYAMAQRELEQPGRGEDYWVLATLGEANVLLDKFDQAGKWYSQALRQATAHGDFGAVAAMRRNGVLIREKIQNHQLEHMFEQASGVLVVFAGHMIDHPDRTAKQGSAPRFPQGSALIAEVEEAIKAFFRECDDADHPAPKLGFCSAANGSDILFAEQLVANARSLELHVVLPFDLNDFYKTSVDFGGCAGFEGWRERCDQVLSNPRAHIHKTTTESHLGDDVLFRFANEYMQGLAILRARQRGITPRALAVIDEPSEAAAEFGGLGTSFFIKTWRKTKYPIHLIPLHKLRSGLDPSSPAPSPTSASPPSSSSSSPSPSEETSGMPAPKAKRPRREIKAMLFADLKDFSTLPEQYTPEFFARYPRFLAKVLKSLDVKPLAQNTWGDGLHLVFGEVADCAEAALRLLEKAETIDWKTLGFKESSSPMRIGVHAGPVYKGKDPVIGKRNYFGSHVTRAARIEPVTTPGCAFASEQFAALLTLKADDDYVCEYLGIEKLAKEYDTVPLYRLTRRWLRSEDGVSAAPIAVTVKPRTV